MLRFPRSTRFAVLMLAAYAASALAFPALALGQFGRTPSEAAGSGLGLGDDQTVTVSAHFTAPRPGRPAELAVTATMKPGWHIYSITQPEGATTPSRIKLSPSDAYKLIGPFEANPAPQKKPEPIFENRIVESHHGAVTWRAPIELSEGADPETLRIRGQLFAQPCDATSCLPPQDFAFTAALAAHAAAGPDPGAASVADAAAPRPAVSSPLPTLEKDQIVAVAARITGLADGGPAELQVAAVIKPGWHVYSLTQAPGGPLKTEIKLKASDQITLLGEFTPEPPPDEKPEPLFGGLVVEKHHGAVIWRAPAEVAEGADPAALRIEGTVRVQPCDADSCLAPQEHPFTAVPGGGFELPRKAAAPGPAPDDLGALAVKLALAFLGGLVLNLMPCVLPVISLKLFSFLQQAGESRARVMALNLWYTLGLMSVFMVLAAFAAAAGHAWGEQFTLAWFKIALTALVFVMALSFLGVWEIPIPGFAGGSAAGQLQQGEGPAGAFFKGAFATVLATPCSGPFLGALFGFLLAQPAYVVFLIFGAVGLGMASPYLVIGAFPHLVRFLPKPGAWMETFKELMGFLLLGTVVFLFSTINAKHFVPTLTLLVGLSFACWWIGRTGVTATPAAKAAAWLGGLGVAAAVGLVAFTVFLYESKMPWQPFSPEALARARAEGKTVMVDFTADWCLTCKTNLKLAIDTRAVRELVEANGVVPMLADWTDESPVIKQALNELGKNSIPVLAIWPAGRDREPIVLTDLLSQREVLDALRQAGPSLQRPPAANVALD